MWSRWITSLEFSQRFSAHGRSIESLLFSKFENSSFNKFDRSVLTSVQRRAHVSFFSTDCTRPIVAQHLSLPSHLDKIVQDCVSVFLSSWTTLLASFFIFFPTVTTLLYFPRTSDLRSSSSRPIPTQQLLPRSTSHTTTSLLAQRCSARRCSLFSFTVERLKLAA